MVVLSIGFLTWAEFHNQGNGGNGGNASSGAAYAFGSGAKAYSGAGGKASGGDVYHRAFVDVRAGKVRFSPQGKHDREHHDYDGLVNVWSGTFLRYYMASVDREHRKQETAEMAAMPSPGTRSPLVLELLPILAPVAMHLEGLCPADGMTKSGGTVRNHSIKTEAATDASL